MKDKRIEQISLADDEIAVKVNISDGVIQQSQSKGLMTHGKYYTFAKCYESATKVLLRKLRPKEYLFLLFLINISSSKDNYLAAFNDSTPYNQLSRIYNNYVDNSELSRLTDKTIKQFVSNFRKIGIILQDGDFWVLNPYISTKTKYINIKTKRLFSNTEITQEIIRDYKNKNKNGLLWDGF